MVGKDDSESKEKVEDVENPPTGESQLTTIWRKFEQGWHSGQLFLDVHLSVCNDLADVFSLPPCWDVVGVGYGNKIFFYCWGWEFT